MASINFNTQTNFYGQSDYIATDDFQFSSEAFVDFESSVFDDETTSTASSLCKASKKISKYSSEARDGSKKSSHKRNSKRARNPWTPREDAKLVELMKKYGQSWAMISSCLEGRTGKQVRDRYLNKLRPNIKLGDWKPEEDDLIVSLLKQVGNRWSLIATHLPGRTEGQVKNRFYSHLKKRLGSNSQFSFTSSRNTSDVSSSFANSPAGDEGVFDFAQEFDFNVANNGCVVNMTETPAQQVQPQMVAKGAYFIPEATYSDQSTTQSPSLASHSPVRVVPADPTDVISYDAPISTFCRQFSQPSFFNFTTIENENQVDEMINNVATYFQNPQQVHVAANVDSFFAESTQQNEEFNFSSVEMNNDRLSQLSKRKAYLELALAKTLKELKGL
jgi:hypothetical protein